MNETVGPTVEDWTYIQKDGRTVGVKGRLLPEDRVRVLLPFVAHDHWRKLAKVWRQISGGIRLHWFRLVQQWYVLRLEVRSLCGHIRILRARRVLEIGLPVGRESSRCENHCSCTCHNDRTPYIRRLYQFHPSASLGELLVFSGSPANCGKSG